MFAGFTGVCFLIFFDKAISGSTTFSEPTFLAAGLNPSIKAPPNPSSEDKSTIENVRNKLLNKGISEGIHVSAFSQRAFRILNALEREPSFDKDDFAICLLFED
ncbi:MAG: hypothetical protein KAS59_04150 [Alphaproteobacteria bacterium]|nr:hypothetical protein [Alphaproteobacteria bacterium]